MLTSTSAQELFEKYQVHFEHLKSSIPLEGAYIEKISSTLKSIASAKMDQETLLQHIINFWELIKGNKGRFEAIINKYEMNITIKNAFKQFLNEKTLIRHIMVYTTTHMLTHSCLNTQLVVRFPNEEIRNAFVSAIGETDNPASDKDFFVKSNINETQTVLIYTEKLNRQSIFQPYIKNIEYNENVKKVFTELVDVNLFHEQHFKGKNYLYYPLKLDLLAHEKNLKLNNVAAKSQLIYTLANDKKCPTFFSCLPTELNINIASFTEEFQNTEEAEKIAMTSYKPN